MIKINSSNTDILMQRKRGSDPGRLSHLVAIDHDPYRAIGAFIRIEQASGDNKIVRTFYGNQTA